MNFFIHGENERELSRMRSTIVEHLRLVFSPLKAALVLRWTAATGYVTMGAGDAYNTQPSYVEA
jgi:hypothetical protein